MGLGRSQHIIGRDAEVDVLRRALGDARGGRARVIVIEGEPGIGKTRLAAELPNQLLAGDDLAIRGHGLQLAGGELAYGVAGEMIRDVSRQLGVDEVRRLAGGHLAALTTLHPALDGIQPATAPAVDRAGLFGAMHHLLVGLAEEHLVCVLVDDLQWVDASSRELLTFLAKVTTHTRTMLVCTVRTTPADADPIARELSELARAENSQTLTLHPLGTAQVHDQVLAVLGEEPSRLLLDQVQALSDGVPLFVEELLAASGGVTNTLRLNLVDRLVDLSEGAQRYLAAAAVAEGHAWPSLVSRASGLDETAADRARNELVNCGLLEVAPDGRDRFHHALLRDAVLGRMSPTARQTWHRTWARTLAADTGPLPAGSRTMVQATHWHASGDRTPEALAATAAAGKAAAHRGGLAEAALWWGRTLEMWPPDIRSTTVDPALGLARDDVLMSTIRSLRREGSNNPGAMRLLGLIDAEQEADPDAAWVKRLYLRLERARVEEETAGTHLNVVAPEDAADMVAALLAEPSDDYQSYCLSLLTVSYSAILPRELLDQAITCVETWDRASKLPENVSATLVWKGFLLAVRGDAEGVLAAHEEWHQLYGSGSHAQAGTMDQALWNLTVIGEYERAAAAVAPQLLASTEPAVVISFRDTLEDYAHVLFALGDWDGAADLLARTVEVAGPSRVAHPHALLARIAALRGDFEQAQRHLDAAAALQSLDEVGSALYRTRGPRLVEAHLSLIRSDPVHALEILDRVLTAPVYGDGAETDYESVWLAARALAAMAEPPPGAVDLVREAASRIATLGRLDASWRPEVELWLTGSNDPAGWSDVVSAWDALGHVYHATVARAGLASALIRDRDRDEAAAVIAQALAAAGALDASPLAEWLGKIAASARLPLASGPLAELPAEARRLTEREFEVLALVAAGRTNRDIAGELFISDKTASVHVSHIIAKLDVTNRTEAAAFAHRYGIFPPSAL